MAQVLLVEDDQWIAACYRQWLQAGHTVRHAHDAQAALDAADEQLPDVIVLDLFLPHANGVQLLHTLRSHADLARVPVVLCSGQLPGDTSHLAAYGVRCSLDKATLTPRRLQQAINEVLVHAAV